MSRIGNSPIVVPEGVNVEINSNELVVSGKLGSLSQIFDGVSVSKEDITIASFSLTNASSASLILSLSL